MVASNGRFSFRVLVGEEAYVRGEVEEVRHDAEVDVAMDRVAELSFQKKKSEGERAEMGSLKRFIAGAMREKEHRQTVATIARVVEVMEVCTYRVRVTWADRRKKLGLRR
jgi:hypothetical protein